MIYFIKRSDGAIRIGTTKHLANRLREHALKHGEVELLGVRDGSYKEENELHHRFAQSRVRHETEWFYETAELIEYITMNTQKVDVLIRTKTPPMRTISAYPWTIAYLKMLTEREPDGTLLADVFDRMLRQVYPNALAAVENGGDVTAALALDECQ